MSKTDLVYCLLKPINKKLSASENFFLEIKLLSRICKELFEIFKFRYQEYQRLIKSNYEQEQNMTSIKLIQEMIKDILSTEEYSLYGIATHTRIPLEVLTDVLTGINPDPTLETSRKIFELHISLKPNLYNEIMRKIALEYLDKPVIC